MTFTAIVIKTTGKVQVVQRHCSGITDENRFFQEMVGGYYETVSINQKVLQGRLIGLVNEDALFSSLSINRLAGYLTGKRMLFGEMVIVKLAEETFEGFELLEADALRTKIEEIAKKIKL